MCQWTAEQLGFNIDRDGTMKVEDIIIPAAPKSTLATSGDSRLIIDTILVNNFKSYAGEVKLGPFDKNLTCIVGANGSGKSNVIDSLLFVFGYRSRKIRSKKVSNLIHKSDKYPNLQSCTVTINFAYIDDENDSSVIPNSRFSVSRTALLDDSSYYEFNNKRTQYKEINRILRAHGIDLEHNRFLILQGEIEAISLMPPKASSENENGMLEYIEDVIGSGRFKKPIEKLQEMAEKLSEECNTLFKQLDLFKKERDALEGPKNRATDYLRLKNRICRTENYLCQLKRYETMKALEHTIKMKEKIIEDMKAFKVELNNTRAMKISIENSIARINSEYDALQKTIEAKKEQYSKLELQDTVNNDLLKNSRIKVQTLEHSLEIHQTELAKLKKQCVVHERETEELQAKKKKLEEEIKNYDKEMEEVASVQKERINMMSENKDKLRSEMCSLKNKSGTIKSEMEIAQKELNLLKSGEYKEQEKLQNLFSDYQNAITSAANEEKYLKSEKEKIKVIEEEIENLKNNLDETEIKEKSLIEQLNAVRMKLEDARTAVSTHSQRNVIVQAFMKEKAQGRFLGVYGRLGDLGAIKEKYDVAISTACGQLDFIVTDFMNTAQDCVEFLKNNNLGYTTFIALDKMKQYESKANAKISTPENVPRLFDLIQVNNKDFLPAFYFALQNTLVAEDLNQATRIGLQGSQRHRVVTLKGELIETSGTMSGGGGKVMKGRMGQKVVDCGSTTQEEVQRLSAQVNTVQNELAAIRVQKSNLKEQISQKQSLLFSLQNLSLKKRQMNLRACNENVKILAAQIDDQKKKVSGIVIDQNKVSLLEREIREKSKEYTKAVEEESDIEQRTTKLEEEILKASEDNSQKFKKNLSELEKNHLEIIQAISKSTVNVKMSQKKIKEVEKNLEAIEIDIESHKEKLANLLQKQSTMTKEGKCLSMYIYEHELKLKKFKESKAELKNEYETIAEQEHRYKQEEIEQKHKLKTIESSESEKHVLLKYVNSKIEKMKLDAVEDDSTELETLSEEEVQNLSGAPLNLDLEIMKEQIEMMNPDLHSIQAFKKMTKNCETKQAEMDATMTKKNLQSRRVEFLSNYRYSEFKAGFDIIHAKLKEIYCMLSLEGDAELESSEGSNPLIKGIEISIRPQKKGWKPIKNLSGGEKTISSLALVFALHHYRPTPFYVMDEIDAALDNRNIGIVAFYLKEEIKNTQFIIVSLRNPLNEMADHLLGITKVNNCTKCISLDTVNGLFILDTF